MFPPGHGMATSDLQTADFILHIPAEFYKQARISDEYYELKTNAKMSPMPEEFKQLKMNPIPDEFRKLKLAPVLLDEAHKRQNESPVNVEERNAAK